MRLGKKKNLDKFRVVIRKVLRKVLPEKEETFRIKLDVADLVEQLNSPQIDQSIRNYFTWKFRLIELIKERSRRAAQDTYDFIDREMRNALFEVDQRIVIESRKEDITRKKGHILDLGVYKGGSTRALARIFPQHTIHGFDSFEGLPEDWAHVKKGTFGELKGVLPDMPDNVKLYKGWFNETLPQWITDHPNPAISLLRVDCDIYSSTKTIFDTLGSFLTSGTWICFDELIGYYGWQEHEHKAFVEFIKRTGLKYKYVAYGLTYTLVEII